jgi:hypothetical protein
MANALSKRWLSGCALLVAMVASLGAETSADPNAAILNSGLHVSKPNGLVMVTVMDAGSKTSSSEVRIELRDAADQRRAFVKGTLMKGRPVRLRFQVPGSIVQQFSANVRITALTNGAGSQPIVTFEEIDVNTLALVTKPTCYPFGGGGVQAHCDGWGVTRLTIGDPGPPDAVDID